MSAVDQLRASGVRSDATGGVEGRDDHRPLGVEAARA